MRCGAADAAECLDLHIKPHIRGATYTHVGLTVRGYAPCHADTKPSMTVGVRGDRIVWNCFACEKVYKHTEAQQRTRNALIQAKIPVGCLPMAKRDSDAERDAIRELVFGKDSHAHKLLRIAALLEGYGELPAGYALEELAVSCGISTREAYKARGASRTTHT